MTYDNWKATEPDYDSDRVPADCDCCGKKRPLTQCFAFGLETWACDECRNLEGE